MFLSSERYVLIKMRNYKVSVHVWFYVYVLYKFIMGTVVGNYFQHFMIRLPDGRACKLH